MEHSRKYRRIVIKIGSNVLTREDGRPDTTRISALVDQLARLHRKEKEIGKICYSTIYSWMCGNRYQFHPVFILDSRQTALKLLEIFYWYWHNYKRLTASRRNRKC